MDSFCERIILSWWLLFIASQDFPFYYTTIIMKEYQGVIATKAFEYGNTRRVSKYYHY